MQQRECEIAALRTELLRHMRVQESSSELLLWRVAGLEAEVSALMAASALSLATVPQPVLSIASAPAPTSPASAVAPPPSGWNSVIAPDFPTLFEDFKKKQFTLLWRGSRDGFGADDFHSRCDGHPKTLTVILDTDGNIFGGFTPVEWDFASNEKADPSLKSFVFILKYPHNFPVQSLRSIVRPTKVQRLHMTLLCGIAATQTSGISLPPLTLVTPTAPGLTGKHFSRVRSVSK
jgi:hypothetical protein